MRKKPLGKLLSADAHRVECEFRITCALKNTDVPVTKAYFLCEDSGVIGTLFHVIEFLDGRIFTGPSLPGVGPRREHTVRVNDLLHLDRLRLNELYRWYDAVGTLAKLYRIDLSLLVWKTLANQLAFITGNLLRSQQSLGLKRRQWILIPKNQ